MPACGPPSSLSPENDTKSQPPESDWPTVGSASGTFKMGGKRDPEPKSSYTITRSLTSAAARRAFSARATPTKSRAVTLSEKPTMR